MMRGTAHAVLFSVCTNSVRAPLPPPPPPSTPAPPPPAFPPFPPFLPPPFAGASLLSLLLPLLLLLLVLAPAGSWVVEGPCCPSASAAPAGGEALGGACGLYRMFSRRACGGRAKGRGS